MRAFVPSSTLLFVGLLGAVGCTHTVTYEGDGGDGGGGSGLHQEPTCEWGGSTYVWGTTFPAGDGCNSCSCDAGEVACTTKGCSSCESLCEAAQACQSHNPVECVESCDSMVNEAANAGCTSELDAVFACYDGMDVCNYEQIYAACEAPVAAYGSCLPQG